MPFFIFFKRTTLSATEGKLCQQVAGEKNPSLGFVVVQSGLIQPRLFLPVHLLALHLHFYPTLLIENPSHFFFHIHTNRTLLILISTNSTLLPPPLNVPSVRLHLQTPLRIKEEW